jgi:LmbE family N-acetylglucosaminyl deacetylase
MESQGLRDCHEPWSMDVATKPPRQSGSRTLSTSTYRIAVQLLAVFAHPDDETIAGPLLAHYGSAPNTRVFIVMVTNGDKGVTPFAGLPAGEQLATVRTKEAACSSAALGAEPPILLGFPDGGLASMQVLSAATARLKAVLDEVRPDAIVTWGPDGGYGHSDHRLVSAMVTELVQAGETTSQLYYAGLPKSQLQSDAVTDLRFPAPFKPVLDDVLNVRVPYSTEDAARARTSLECHISQFTPATMALISKLTDQVHAGQMHLRHWTGGASRTDLFER